MIEDEGGEAGRPTFSREAPAAVSVAQRQAIVSHLSDGMSPSEVAAKIGVTPRQVSGIKAHVSMGTYREDADAVRDRTNRLASGRYAGADVAR
jgi:DNA-binding CsgD family transcriptional regulator